MNNTLKPHVRCLLRPAKPVRAPDMFYDPISVLPGEARIVVVVDLLYKDFPIPRPPQTRIPGLD